MICTILHTGTIDTCGLPEFHEVLKGIRISDPKYAYAIANDESLKSHYPDYYDPNHHVDPSEGVVGYFLGRRVILDTHLNISVKPSELAIVKIIDMVD